MVAAGAVAVLVASAAILAMAAWLVVLSPRHRATRALALFLVFLAAFSALLNLPSADPPNADYYRRLTPYFLLFAAVAMLHLAAVYPAPRRWLPRGLPPAAAFLAAMVVLGLLYAWDHGLYADYDRPVATPLGPGYNVGPLGLLYVFVLLPAFYTVPALFLRDALRAPPGRGRGSLLLLSLGLALFAVHAATAGLYRGIFLGSSLFGLSLLVPDELRPLLLAARVAPIAIGPAWVCGPHGRATPMRAGRDVATSWPLRCPPPRPC